jgi:hypothetical protein
MLRAEAERAELDLAERRGELVTVDYMAAEFERIAQSLRAQLLAIPTAWAPVSDKCKTTLDRQLVLRDEVNNILPMLGEAVEDDDQTMKVDGTAGECEPEEEEEERMTSPLESSESSARDAGRSDLGVATRSASDRAVAFAPKSHLTLSQWSDKYRVLSADTGNGGRWRTDRVPYLRRIMDAITDPRVRKVSVMKSARIGATQAIVINSIFYCVDQDPCARHRRPAHDRRCLKFSSKLLQPAIDDTEVVAKKISSEKSKKKRSTMLEKTYPGGSLQIIGTKSPRAARMVHGRYILKSEIDAWEGSAGSDGDPYNLIDKRAGSYDNPKFVEESTPLVRETSRIEPAFHAGSMEYYHVPCPHCETMQRLVWGGKDEAAGIKWGRKADGSPDLNDVYYVCEQGCVIYENEKNSMVARGEWIAMHPERIDHLSFHLNALVSPFDGARWPVLVDEWHKTARKPEKVRVFVNTVLGETYVEEGEQADGDTLTQRRDAGTWWSEADSGASWRSGAHSLGRHPGRSTRNLSVGVGRGRRMLAGRLGDAARRSGDDEPWDALDERVGYKKVSGRLTTAEPKKYKHVGGSGAHAAHDDDRRRWPPLEAGEVVHPSSSSEEDLRHLRCHAGTRADPRQPSPHRPIHPVPVGSFAGKEALIKRIDKIDEPGPASSICRSPRG